MDRKQNGMAAFFDTVALFTGSITQSAKNAVSTTRLWQESPHNLGLSVVLLQSPFFLLLLLVTGTIHSAQAQESYRIVLNQLEDSRFPEVTAYISVLSANGLSISGLDSKVFELIEDSAEITGFSFNSVQNAGEPLNLVIAVDHSESMLQKNAMDNTKDAVAKLLDKLGANDAVAIVSFSSSVEVLQETITDKQAAKAIVQTLSPIGQTLLWDATYQAVDIAAGSPAGRKAVIVITDGWDNTSVRTLDELLVHATDVGVPIFPVGFGATDVASLNTLAGQTGGEAFVSDDSTALGQQFDQILQRLQLQYVLSYKSALPADATEHTLRIRVNHLGTSQEVTGTFVAKPRDVQVSFVGLVDGETTGGVVRLQPHITGPADIARVEYTVNGQPLATVTAAPFEYQWDTTSLAIGNYTLTAIAIDTANNRGETTLALNIVPVIDLKFVAPVEPDNISGETQIAVQIESLAEIASVEFSVDGAPIASITSAPYQFKWDSATVPPGVHTLTARAVDVSNRTAEISLPIRVQVGINWGLLVAVLVLAVSVTIILPLATRFRRQRIGTPAPPATGPAGSITYVLKRLDVSPPQQWPLQLPQTRLGRSRVNNEVALEGVEISRQHAVIDFTDGRYIYRDLAPKIPSLINGQPISGSHELQEGDRIEISGVTLVFGRVDQ
jgi:VWFA-related protein